MPEDEVKEEPPVSGEEKEEATPKVETPEAPVAEQEQPPSKEGDDSVAPQEETEAPDAFAVALEAIEGMAKDNPESAEKLRAALGQEEKPVDEERVDWELEQSATERTTRWSNAQAQYNQSGPQLQQQLTTYLESLDGNLVDAAKRLHAGDISDPEDVSFDVDRVVQALMPLFTSGQNAAYGLAQAADHFNSFAGLEEDSTYRLLTGDERKQFAMFRSKNDIKSATKLQLAAATRGPTADAIAAQAKEAAEQQNGTLKQAEKVIAALGKGKTPEGEAPKGATTLEEVDEALRTGPTKDYDKNMAIREALVSQS